LSDVAIRLDDILRVLSARRVDGTGLTVHSTTALADLSMTPFCRWYRRYVEDVVDALLLDHYRFRRDLLALLNAPAYRNARHHTATLLWIRRARTAHHDNKPATDVRTHGETCASVALRLCCVACLARAAPFPSVPTAYARMACYLFCTTGLCAFSAENDFQRYRASLLNVAYGSAFRIRTIYCNRYLRSFILPYAMHYRHHYACGLDDGRSIFGCLPFCADTARCYGCFASYRLCCQQH